MGRKMDGETAFLKEFIPARDDILSYIYSMVRVHAEVEDIFQDVSIVLWEKFDTFKPGTNFGAWARGIVRFKVMNERRRKKEVCWDPQVIEALDRAFETDKDSLVDMKAALLVCIDKLSTVNKNIVKYKYGEKRPHSEIAGILKRSVAGLNVILHRIRAALGQCVRREMNIETGV